MISTNIFAFVLALVAVVCAAAAWITCLRLKLELESWRSTNVSNYKALSVSCTNALSKMQRLAHELEAKTPEKLAGEVAALSESVAKLADTQRRFQGRFYASLKQSDAKDDVEETAEQVRARLRLKHGLPKLGGAGNSASEE